MRPYSIWALLAPTSLWLDLATAAGIHHGADPSVIWAPDNNYYSVEALSGGVSIRKSPDLAGFADVEPQSVWKDDNNLGSIWAPEIEADGDRYLIYFAGGNNPNHRMYVIGSDQPGSGYATKETELKLPDDQWAIDGTLFRYHDKLWFAWSGMESKESKERIGMT